MQRTSAFGGAQAYATHYRFTYSPIPFMAKSPTYGQGPVAVAPYNYTWQNVAIYSGTVCSRCHPRLDFARID